MELLKNPKIEEAEKVLNIGISKKHAIIVSAKCIARYSGRAESYLPAGDRIIFIKPDTTILLHQISGSQPVNWMPGQTTHSVIRKENNIVLNSSRQSEKLNIELTEIYFINSMQLEDAEKIQSQGSEKDMAEMLYKNPDMIEKGFKPYSMEEHTKYGFIDVFGNDAKGNLLIVECKRYNADLGAVTQLRRYVEKIKKTKGVGKVRGMIAAPKISPNALKMLQDWDFSFKKVEPPKYFEEKKKEQMKLDGF